MRHLLLFDLVGEQHRVDLAAPAPAAPPAPVASASRGRLFSSALTCPGCGDSSRMRLPILIASGIECVTNSTVNRVSSHSCSSSSCILRRVSASSAANGSSISRMSGSIAMPRAIATRCFMPPDSVCGRLSANFDEVDLGDRVARLFPRGGAGEPAARHQREHHVLGDRLPRQQLVEFLEHHHPVGTGPRHDLALQPDLALDRAHVAADRLQQRGLAAARRPEQDEAVGAEDLEIDAIRRGDEVVLASCTAASRRARRAAASRRGRCRHRALPTLPGQPVEVDVAARDDHADRARPRRRACARAGTPAAPPTKARSRSSSAPRSCASRARSRPRSPCRSRRRCARIAASVRARERRAQAVGDRRRRRQRLHAPRAEAARGVVGVRRLRAVDARSAAAARAPRWPCPDSSPPPPTGAITMSRSGTASSELERRRPLPGDDPRVVERMDQRRARLGLRPRRRRPRARRRWARRSGSSRRSRRTFSCFTFGAFSGITTHAAMPRCRAAYASAAPWLPDECVTTPRRASASVSENTALVAPRALNAPTFWKFSHLKKSRAPASASIAAAGQHRRAVHVRARSARAPRGSPRDRAAPSRPARVASGISCPPRRGCSGRTGPSTSRASP